MNFDFTDATTAPSEKFASFASKELIPIYSSLALLYISAIDDGLAGRIATVMWLGSLAAITMINKGAGFAIYLVSIALFNPKHVWDPGPIWDRVDNFGLFVMLLALILIYSLEVSSIRRKGLFALMVIFAFYNLGLAKMRGLMGWYNFAQFIRIFGLPFVFYFLLSNLKTTSNEIRAYSGVIVVLGVYMALISLLEQFELYYVIEPSWVRNPNLNMTIGTGRSGGPLMQAEFNGFALGLIACVTIGNVYLNRHGYSSHKYFALLFCLAGIYCTYTRAAWMAVTCAAIIFLFKPTPPSRWKIEKKLALVIICLLFLPALLFYSSEKAQERLGDKGTVEYRIKLWTAGLLMAMSNPLFGHGMGQFEKTAPEHAAHIKSLSDSSFNEEGAGAHNIFISIIAEQGFLGLTLYISIITLIVSHSLRSARRIWKSNGTFWVLAFSATYLINSQFINLHEIFTNLLYFGSLGLISGLGDSAQQTSKRKG